MKEKKVLKFLEDWNLVPGAFSFNDWASQTIFES
jgi:hypothetical protein